MLDHVFSDAISALRDAFSNAFLERQAFDEHFNSDVLLGDLVWETSYGLPGEGRPPRVVAHITLTWPSWSQAIYRSWYTDEIFHEAPEIEMEIVFRVQRLAVQPDATIIEDIVPIKSPQIGKEKLSREGITVEINQPTPSDKRITRKLDYAIEVTYRGNYELAEETLQDGTSKLLDENFSTLGSWIATTLVNLGDLKLAFLPVESD
ncbi:MAG: hypothetical protein EB028_03255 [Actinobacteria bacterium]|nr:hypothetical protein [Actinomycetota bacterium]NDA37436.1 hypothetical protein [Acidimicrobiia bacterium]HBQ52126.1 hypothetical protein [Acidimicrobium sp.]NBY62206.1 hypothetical protein [Actinomycetota bacterium]NDB26944.1 hypothetical protein [Actinomycetota bacterium]